MHLVFGRGLAHFLGSISVPPPGDAAVELPVREPLRALHEEAVLGVVPVFAGAPGARDLLVHCPGGQFNRHYEIWALNRAKFWAKFSTRALV